VPVEVEEVGFDLGFLVAFRRNNKKVEAMDDGLLLHCHS
jgi:hypothetical protein